MTKEEVFALADASAFHTAVQEAELLRFAALVAAHEREACARVCDELVGKAWVEDCADAIRSRT